MAHNLYQKIIALIRQAAKLAKTVGIQNILQPGLVKEMIIAELLGHELITAKRDADACDPRNKNILYEYLSCKEGGSGQFDRMFKSPPDKRRASLIRITRNAKIYFAVFYATEQTQVKNIYELSPDVVLAETERQLNQSRNDIAHVGFSENWAKANGKLVYQSKS